MKTLAAIIIVAIGIIFVVDIFTDTSDPVRVCKIETGGGPYTAFTVSTTGGVYYISNEAMEMKDKIKEGGTYKFTHRGSLPLLRSDNIKAIEQIDASLVSATCP